jgi:SpoVK/Ycf46/Vps4 family AAA+-type ATPase
VLFRSENVRVNPVLSTLHMWLRLLLRQRPPNVMVMGITERPHLVDKSIVEGFSVPLYFDITSPETITEIIQKSVKNNSVRVADELLEQLNDLNLNPVSAEVIRALSSIEPSSLEKLSIEEIVKAIRRNLTPSVSNEAIKKYREENRELISLSSRYTIPHYSKLELAS